MKNLLLLALLLLLLIGCNDRRTYNMHVSVVPLPKSMDFENESIALPVMLKNSYDSGTKYHLSQFIIHQWNHLFPIRNQSVHSIHLPLILNLNESLMKEEYELQIKKDQITIEASTDVGFIRAAATLLQLPNEGGKLPLGIIKDHPDYNYRSVMIDASRSWYSVATLKQIIDLCFWYKIKYLHLHLTDDGLFTFPSKAFPKLASDQSYTLEELQELDEYARSRGCTLIPEIDIPGHSSVFVAQYPEIFGLHKNLNYWTINMGKQEGYDAIKQILEEVAEAFPNSPYIHVGGDEVNFYSFEDDPDIKAFMKKHKINTYEDLYHHFIKEVTQMVKDLGRQSIIWSGFDNKGNIKIPNDVIVMLWTTGAYFPDDLAEEGFKIINASWNPLYVVNNRKWSSEEIYQWNPNIWKGSETPSDYPGIALSNHNNNLLGSSMEVWEQREYKALLSLRHRLPAMSERLWDKSSTDYNAFSERLKFTNERLSRFLHGFELIEEGLSYPEWKDSNFDEYLWYSDSVTIAASELSEDINVGYYFFESSNLKRYIPNASELIPIDKPIKLIPEGPMMFQAYRTDAQGKKKHFGHPIFKNYAWHPIQLEAKGLLDQYLPHNWLHHKYTDSLQIILNTEHDGDIHYTLDNKFPTILDKKYDSPIILKDNTRLKAQLYDNVTKEPKGKPTYQEYVKVGLETSLTTGKPVTTSNGNYELGVASVVNDGQIARWDHWGDHADGENWIMIDLGEEKVINKFKTYTFWDSYRYYEYTIEVSSDQKDWKMVVDRSNNRELSTPNGTTDIIEPIKARFLKLNVIRNSANPGLHVVEFNAF